MLKHPFFHFVLLLAFSYLFFTYGLAILTKPIPSALVRQYMGIMLGVLLLYMASGDARWTAFKQPLYHTLLGSAPIYKIVRILLFVLLPAYVGFFTYGRLKPQTTAPPPFRTVHPANPESITFLDGEDTESFDLTSQTNPLRRDEANLEQHLAAGKKVYYERCFYCHGDTWSGDGHFAAGFVPIPAKFTGDETLAILSESYVFWRIAKGGPGLPREASPWDSAMPAWEGRLSENEIWSVIMYLYDAIGKEPRAIGGHAQEEAH